jgi:hypothetical protein
MKPFFRGILAQQNPADNCYNVIKMKHLTDASLLSGFTITGGNGVGGTTFGARNRVKILKHSLTKLHIGCTIRYKCTIFEKMTEKWQKKIAFFVKFNLLLPLQDENQVLQRSLESRQSDLRVGKQKLDSRKIRTAKRNLSVSYTAVKPVECPNHLGMRS